MCVSDVDFFSVSLIFRLYFGTVQTVTYEYVLFSYSIFCQIKFFMTFQNELQK